MKPGRWSLVASLVAVVLAVGAYMAFFAAPRAVAGLALQVNPAVTLTLGERNTVIDAEGLDARGESLLAGLELTGREMPEALRLIADALHEAGLLGDERRILVALHPVGDRAGEAELTATADTVRQTLGGYLAEHGLAAEVASVVLTAELADAARAAGLFPADYVDLVAAVGSPVAMQALNLQRELALDPVRFKEEFGTIAAALIDMTEAGIAGDNALAVLKGALTADPELEELATITAAMIDLHQAGATQKDMMSVFALLEERAAAGVERALLLEEITTVTAAKIDLMDAGVPAATALAVLRTALQADPKLEELTTITAAMADLVEEGLSEEEALARIQRAIKADPTLQDFDDLIEAPEEREEASGATEAGRPQPAEPQREKAPGATKPAEEREAAPGADQPAEEREAAPGVTEAGRPQLAEPQDEPQGPALTPGDGANGEN
ncbi:MAG: hypothetical protein AB1402_05220 [Bacillota bacterium]